MTVVGIDAGGTSTRALAVDAAGTIVGSGRSSGANLNSSADATRAIRVALAEALPTGCQADVVVLAAAGAGPAGRPRAEAIARAAIAAAGVSTARLIVHSDIEAAFASGSVDPDGTVLVAGTGAVAARIEGYRVARRWDGHGYRLGDNGSAFWVGAAAARAVLAELNGAGAATTLRGTVLDHVRGEVADRDLGDQDAIEAAVYANAPAWLGTLAPLVEAAATAGDAVALGIVGGAVDALVATAALAGPAATLVVTGAVATGAGPLGSRVRAALETRLGVRTVVVRDGSIGAAALALRAVPSGAAGIADRLVRSAMAESSFPDRVRCRKAAGAAHPDDED